MQSTGYICSVCSSDKEEVEMEIVRQEGHTFIECPICEQSYPA